MRRVDGSLTCVIVTWLASVTWISTKCEGSPRNTPGLTCEQHIAIRQYGSRTVRESRTPSMFGMSGPAVHEVVSGSYTAVCAVPQIWNIRPFGRSDAGPISCEPAIDAGNRCLVGLCRPGAGRLRIDLDIVVAAQIAVGVDRQDRLIGKLRPAFFVVAVGLASARCGPGHGRPADRGNGLAGIAAIGDHVVAVRTAPRFAHRRFGPAARRRNVCPGIGDGIEERALVGPHGAAVDVFTAVHHHAAVGKHL